MTVPPATVPPAAAVPPATRGAAAAGGSVEDLYPFLYQGSGTAGTSLEDVLAQVASSTVAKADEILRLRRRLRDTEAARLAGCAAAMAERFAAGGRLLAFGNGGSATDAAELATLFLNPGDGRPLPALSLASDAAVLTALGNDVGIDVVFARQIAAFGRPGDIAVGLSTSGNSANLPGAFGQARRRGLLTIGLAGYSGGAMAELDTLDWLFVAPSASVHRIQEAQVTICHVLWELVQGLLADAGPAGPGARPPERAAGLQAAT